MNGLNGRIGRNTWHKYISPRDENNINITPGLSDDDFDQLSASDRRILDGIWEKLGGMTASQLRNWIHINCLAYVLVEHGRLPITLLELAKATGFSNPSQLEWEVTECRHSEVVLS